MSCAAFYRRRRERPANVAPSAYRRQLLQRPGERRALAAGLGATDWVPEILGTWDYKWPLGSQIRVAFQKPPESMNVTPQAFQDARSKVEALALRWRESLATDPKYEALLTQLPKLEFLQSDDQLFEPPLGPENSITDQHRSPFRTDKRIQYDVLVSLQDLPVTRADPFRGFGEELEELVIPTCDLGSYARRSDYAAPTVYLGRYGKYLEEDLVDYLDMDVGRQTVVHIFGHVFGLAHSYQHPTLVEGLRSEFYQPTSAVIEFIKRNLGIELTQEMVNENLLQIWPGDLEFSDWLDFTPAERAAHRKGNLDSVMTPPYYSALIEGTDAAKSGALPEEFVTLPSARDLDTLRLMYEPGAAAKLPVSKPPGAAQQLKAPLDLSGVTADSG